MECTSSVLLGCQLGQAWEKNDNILPIDRPRRTKTKHERPRPTSDEVNKIINDYLKIWPSLYRVTGSQVFHINLSL